MMTSPDEMMRKLMRQVEKEQEEIRHIEWCERDENCQTGFLNWQPSFKQMGVNPDRQTQSFSPRKTPSSSRNDFRVDENDGAFVASGPSAQDSIMGSEENKRHYSGLHMSSHFGRRLDGWNPRSQKKTKAEERPGQTPGLDAAWDRRPRSWAVQTRRRRMNLRSETRFVGGRCRRNAVSSQNRLQRGIRPGMDGGSVHVAEFATLVPIWRILPARELQTLKSAR
jgi:hypothetical protein